MTSGLHSQSDSLESHGNRVNNNNIVNTFICTTRTGVAGIELIVSIDGEPADETELSPVSSRSSDRSPRIEQTDQRRGSLPDGMRLLPPIKDHDFEASYHHGKKSAGGSISLRSSRSNSPMLLDRGETGFHLEAPEPEKMLPALYDGGMATHRTQTLLSHSSHSGSSSLLGRSLSPRPPSPSFPYHTSRDRHMKPSDIHILQRRYSEEKQATSLDSKILGRTLKPDSPLSDITDSHPMLQRRRSCQPTKRIPLPRRASEGVLPLPPSHLGNYPYTKNKLEQMSQPGRSLSSGKEVGELITPGGKNYHGKKQSGSLGFSRISKLNSASLEAIHKHEDVDSDSEHEKQRILNWLEGVTKGSLDDREGDLRNSEIIPLKGGGSETAIRIIHND
ncbi:uncharacterized protein LOC117301060 [Asterias rubens]|uniref:uncharacterized protein LOC117301060 n=1 Tax=Asterias rubens TaxID=7604 RepID=UPI0014552DF8|nr:uncharacterized protein LOC117301060 [Asterias rubens]